MVPAKIVPSVLQDRHDVIDQFLHHPIDLEGKKASELITKKARRRRRRRSQSPDEVGELPDDEPKRKKEKKKKEEKKYKSAQFIEDSDDECGDMEAFLEREKVLRERTARAAEESGRVATMRAAGTKKRRKRKTQDGAGSSKRARTSSPAPAGDSVTVVDVDSDSGHSSDDEVTRFLRSSRSPTPPPAPKPRPKPRIVQKKSRASDPVDISSDSDREAKGQETAVHRPPPKRRLFLSDDEEI